MKKINILVSVALLATTLSAQSVDTNNTFSEFTKVVNEHKKQQVKPYYQGTVVKTENAGGYTYLEIKEHNGKTFWVAVSASPVKVGDYVRFQKELVTKNFKSKTLNKTFDELMFGSDLQYKVVK
ncbi:MAG: hypothetical protein GQ570_14390 [Helicobacteraceae bacterium]|nr:hypothetical protein [Helicobacteraceae bacterium]